MKFRRTMNEVLKLPLIWASSLVNLVSVTGCAEANPVAAVEWTLLLNTLLNEIKQTVNHE